MKYTKKQYIKPQFQDEVITTLTEGEKVLQEALSRIYSEVQEHEF